MFSKIVAIAFVTATVFSSSGCFVVGEKAVETHRKGIQSAFEEEYVIPKKPVDRHYIGSPWSKQFGPVEDPGASDIRIRKERSLNSLQQDFARGLGLSASAQGAYGSITGASAGIRSGALEKTRLEGVEIITPVSLADIQFKPKLAYVTEALRLTNFNVRQEKTGSGNVGIATSTPLGGLADIGSAARSSTEGEGLVVAYKLHTIDLDNYTHNETGNISLELGRTAEIAMSNLIIRPRLEVIKPGTSISLPRNLLWACPRAEAMSRNMVAAWIVDIKPTVTGRKSLSIAFPAHPKVEDCQQYNGVLFSMIDPLTDQIVRQKIDLVLVDAELNDSLQPLSWVTKVSVVDERFKIKPAKSTQLE